MKLVEWLAAALLFMLPVLTCILTLDGVHQRRIVATLIRLSGDFAGRRDAQEAFAEVATAAPDVLHARHKPSIELAAAHPARAEAQGRVDRGDDRARAGTGNGRDSRRSPAG